MKHIVFSFLLSIFFAFNFNLYSNSSDTSSDWQTYHEDEHVRIEYLKSDCNLPSMGYHHVYKYLRFTNLTNFRLQVTFDKALWYNGTCLSCDNSPENRYTVSLLPVEQKAGSCADRSDNNLQIFHSMIKPANPSILSKFELRNITVEISR